MPSNYPTEKRLSVIKCECGFEIPVVPEDGLLGEAIDSHVEEHRTKEHDLVKGERAAKRVHDYLFSQLFKKISEMTP